MTGLLDWPDLPDAEVACLRRLTRDGEGDAGAIALALAIDVDAARALLDGLAERGLVTADDGRYRAVPGRRRSRAAGIGSLLDGL